MKRIRLTRGKYALIDNADLALVSRFKWQAQKGRCGHWVAKTHVRRQDGTRRIVLMHRLILGISRTETDVDHKNLNPLDNRRQNLRLASTADNIHNQRGRRPGQYKGAYLACGRWRAAITVNYKTMHIGSFGTAREAAHAYDKAARKYFGDFAYTNFK